MKKSYSPLLWTALALFTVLFLGSVTLIVLTIVFVDNVDTERYWASLTGPIGDTFGGVLGPILNALVLVSTVWVAVVLQPRQVEAERRESAEHERAAGVVGWVAETEDQSYVGVVVTNAADSLVYKLDIFLRAEHAGFEPRGDREISLPPGTWFIPFLVGPSDVRQPGPDDFAWRLPVPVRNAEGMEVTLKSLSDDPSETSAKFYLRPHLPEERDGDPLPHFSIAEFRYELHGTPWMRSASGEPKKADPLSDEQEAARQEFTKVARESARTGVTSQRVRPELETLIRYTFKALCATDAALGRDAFVDALVRPLDVNANLLPGVKSMSRPTTGGRIQFDLVQPDGAHLWMAQNHESYPANVHLRGPGGVTYRIDGLHADGQVKKAGARAVGLRNAGELTRPASEWTANEGAKAEWLEALRAMVEAASEAKLATVAESMVDNEDSTDQPTSSIEG